MRRNWKGAIRRGITWDELSKEEKDEIFKKYWSAKSSSVETVWYEGQMAEDDEEDLRRQAGVTKRPPKSRLDARLLALGGSITGFMER